MFGQLVQKFRRHTKTIQYYYSITKGNKTINTNNTVV